MQNKFWIDLPFPEDLGCVGISKIQFLKDLAAFVNLVV